MKTLGKLFFLGFVSLKLFAGSQGGSDSCGLGWEVTDKKTFSATTTRGTTNATIPPTFGMTTGTIGCDQHSLVKNEKRLLHYIDGNRELVMRDMATGEGEYLTQLTSMMGIRGEAGADCFQQAGRQNFSRLNKTKNAGEMLRLSKQLASSCALL